MTADEPIGDFELKDPSLTTHAVPLVIHFAKLLHFSSVILYLSSRIDVLLTASVRPLLMEFNALLKRNRDSTSSLDTTGCIWKIILSTLYEFVACLHTEIGLRSSAGCSTLAKSAVAR